MTLGEKLRAVREHLGLSQHEMGEKLGYHQGAVSLYELDRRRPPFKVLLMYDAYIKVNKLKINLLEQSA